MHAALVGAGILASRLFGLARESLKARYLGASGSIAADAFHAAFRIPNILQNLLGEGALSASLIPVYANKLAKGDQEEADRIASAVGAILALMAAVIVIVGVTLAPVIVAVLNPGFDGEKRELTVMLTRILFPGAALFVFSAWCLGILNSHRKFLLSYAAPVAWNAAMIGALIIYRDSTPTELAVRIAWASVIGAALQFLVQVPSVLKVTRSLKLWLGKGNAGVRTVIGNFVPAFFSRGVVQINAFVDQMIASFLPTGAMSLLAYTQTLTMLPISLFGMSVAAAQLPAMSSALGDEADIAASIRRSLESGLRNIAYFVIPSAVGYLLLGDAIARALYRHGRFTDQDVLFTWGILAAASVGLLASTLGRLYSSAFFALRDTRTPLRISLIRVAVATALGAWMALKLPGMLGIAAQWGAATLALSSSTVGWIEFALLRRRLNARVGQTGLPWSFTFSLLGAALAAGGGAYLVKISFTDMHRILLAIAAIGTFALIYGGVTLALGVPEARALTDKVSRRVNRR